MVPIAQIRALLRDTVIEWRNTDAANLLFQHRDTAILVLILAIGVCAVMLVGRALTRRRGGRTQVALPAVLQWTGGSWMSVVRHGALLLFLAGLPFFVMALADPYSSVTREEVSFPGRRIALMIDASASMMVRFPDGRFNAKAENRSTFFTTVGAAEAFIRQRMAGKYHDLIGLVEFGDEAYVVTPFTTDYENILLSLSLIGDWTEFMKFPNEGTTIGLAVEQATSLFQAFDFLGASGNLMVLFSDGQDDQVRIRGKSLKEIMARAVQTKIPVYMIRTSYNKAFGGVLPDAIWKPAIEETGGKFYAAADENTILAAIKDIDARSSGRVEVKRYSSQRPKFTPYAFIATSLWAVALALQLTVPWFRKFP